VVQPVQIPCSKLDVTIQNGAAAGKCSATQVPREILEAACHLIPVSLNVFDRKNNFLPNSGSRQSPWDDKSSSLALTNLFKEPGEQRCPPAEATSVAGLAAFLPARKGKQSERHQDSNASFHVCSRFDFIPLIHSSCRTEMPVTFRDSRDQKRTLMPPLATTLCWVLEDSATLRFGLPDKKSRTSSRKPMNRYNL
jgi:hypothetical protein